MKENNKPKPDKNTSDDTGDNLSYSVVFDLQYPLTAITPEKQSELAFMNDYFCLSAVLWAIGNVSYTHKNEDIGNYNPVIVFEQIEYLSYIGKALMEDMSARMQRQYFNERRSSR